MKKNLFEVIFSKKNEKWLLKQNKQALKFFDTQKEALLEAMDLAETLKQHPKEIRIEPRRLFN